MTALGMDNVNYLMPNQNDLNMVLNRSLGSQNLPNCGLNGMQNKGNVGAGMKPQRGQNLDNLNNSMNINVSMNMNLNNLNGMGGGGNFGGALTGNGQGGGKEG